MTRPLAPFGKTLVRVYGAFLATAITAGIIFALDAKDWRVGLLFIAYSFFYGLVMGAFASPMIAATWMLVRRKTGEGLPACLAFGLVPGVATAALFASPRFEPLAFAIFIALGAFGGWLYWALTRRGLPRMHTPAACPVEQLFD